MQRKATLQSTTNTKMMALTSLFTALISIGAFIKIPLGDVPISLQLTFVLISGFLLGKKFGPLSVIIYILLGLSGIPIFTGGGGINYIFRPSFGYLIGMIFSSYFVGFFAQSKILKSPIKTTVIAFIGVLICYVYGFTYMFLIYKFYLGKTIVLWNLLYSGVLIFIPKDAFLCFLTSLFLNKMYHYSSKFGR